MPEPEFRSQNSNFGPWRIATPETAFQISAHQLRAELKANQMKAKILKAECHAHGVNLVTTRGRGRALHFAYHEFAFTPEIRDHNSTERRRAHTTVPFFTIGNTARFTLTRTK